MLAPPLTLMNVNSFFNQQSVGATLEPGTKSQFDCWNAKNWFQNSELPLVLVGLKISNSDKALKIQCTNGRKAHLDKGQDCL